MQLVDRDLLVGADRDDLLREHVERVARDHASPRSRPPACARRRPRTRAGRRGTSGRCARARRRRAGGRRARPAAARARPTSATRPARRGRRRPCRCRARATTWRRGTGISPVLEQLLDLEALLLARERAVVGARDLASLAADARSPARSAQREALGEPAVVDEDDRRAVLPDELEDLAGRSSGQIEPALAAARRMSSSGHDDLRGRAPSRAGVDELDRPARRRRSARSPPVGRCVAESPIALERAASVRRSRRSTDSARCAPRFVPATRVHLVEDQRLDRRAASRAPRDVSRR